MTTTAMSTGAPAVRPLSLVAAAMGSAAVLLHGWTAAGQSRDLLMIGLMLAMSLICVPCVVAVWRRCTAHTMAMLMAMSLGCALLNGGMLVGFNSTMAMDHGGASARAGVAGSSAHAPLMLVVIALEIVTAGIAAACVRRFTVRR